MSPLMRPPPQGCRLAHRPGPVTCQASQSATLQRPCPQWPGTEARHGLVCQDWCFCKVASVCFAELRDAAGYIMSRAPSGGQPGYPVPWRHPRLPELGTLLPEPVATTVILKTSTGGSEGTWTQHSVLRKEIQESDWSWVAQGW